MTVRNTLEQVLAEGSGSDSAAVEDARWWLARTEVLLDWLAKHPHLVEVNCEAARLLATYTGEESSAIDVDYRGLPTRKAMEA